MVDMYNFSCEHCGGRVAERRVEREVLRHKGGQLAEAASVGPIYALILPHTVGPNCAPITTRAIARPGA